ncbi:GNAT family N-acetyltransferase [Actinomadura darangshiensis]|uniref:GNAT family N-acetyltransferase n=1 Tax=Actinomadura darangshiensis TaxID=705336 RepID=A0A4R5BIY5_9ACTN|nr:GNAT family N-acetyltransferase [Actinomadura darangshiensis]TDD85745.1 GNAT family N-acetyltransferase [Actinomadura darangshiensis]
MTSQPRPAHAVRTAADADAEAIAAVLGRAFDDDPVWRWLLPDDASRVRRMTGLFGILLRRVHLRHAATEAAGRGGGAATEAAALWDPPGHWRVPARLQATQALPLLRITGTRTPAVLRTLGEIEKHHPPEPHWYLAVLGTDPPAQGNGLGGALLRSRLGRCDDAGLPAYLESSKERNVPYYERFGFRVTRELALPGKGCPPVWLMWREPGQGR